jgi:hypothetical protein
MAAQYIQGLTSVKIGAIAGDGGMGTALTILGNTKPGTMKLTTADGTTTNFNIEEQDDPILTTTTKGVVTLSWSTVNVEADMLQRLFGGTVTGTAPKVWNAPDKITPVEQSVEVTAASGQVLKIVRASLAPQLNLSFTKTEIGEVAIVATILAPTKAATPTFTLSNAA